MAVKCQIREDKFGISPHKSGDSFSNVNKAKEKKLKKTSRKNFLHFEDSYIHRRYKDW